MHTLAIIALVVFGLGLAGLGFLAHVLRSVFSRQDAGAVEDETRLVQDMYRTLNRLEERVAVLETLLNNRRGAHHDG